MFFSFFSWAHPAIALVKDSKGTIYYSDLRQVWKISQGKKSIFVPHVHTHELYLDKEDNLYGENEIYKESTAKFYHYLWVLRPNGVIDTVVHLRESYWKIDYSLARDGEGNQYYSKQFLKSPDTKHIYKWLKDGRETFFATGDFTGVRWLHPQKDGSLFYVQRNAVYRISANGQVKLLAKEIGSKTPAFKFSGNSITLWGVWQDASHNVYVAIFSDQIIKKIQSNGRVTDFYQSKRNWAPTQGLFDDKGQLWLMESSDKNEIRVFLCKQGSISNHYQTLHSPFTFPFFELKVNLVFRDSFIR